jgi:prevent-host-death family protein
LDVSRMIKSSDIQRNFNSVLDKLKDGPIFILRYSEVRAVLLSVEEYNRLKEGKE